MTPNRHAGFTLSELLVTLAMLGILLGIAIPKFATIIERNRQNGLVYQLQGTLHHARTHAITTRQSVSICSGNSSCNDTQQWSGQLLSFRDPNRNGQIDLGEDILLASSLPDDYSWYWSNFRSQSHMSFKPDGTTHGLNGTFTLCHDDTPKRQIVINLTGRARLQTPPTNTACR